jgi:hypothetical protein
VNATIREGFVREDMGDVDPSISPNDEGLDGIERRKPKVVYQAPRGPEAKEPPVIEQPAAEPAKPASDKDAGAPPPLDLDAPPTDLEWPVRLKLLYRPTRNTKNQVIHELLIRAPTAGDISRCGNPVRLNNEGDVIVDEEKMTRMLSALSDVFPPMIETLDARDWISCSFFMQRILLPNRATWEPTSS